MVDIGAVNSVYLNDNQILTNKQIDIQTNPLILRNETYLIWKDGSTYYARHGTTGALTSNAEFSTLIQAIIDAIPTRDDTVFTHIKLAAGIFDVNTPIDIGGKYNLHIQGSGTGVTRIQAGPTLGDGGAVIRGNGAVSGTSKNLTANANAKQKTVTMSSGDAATFAVNDWVLLRATDLFSVASSGSALKGEIKQIVSIAAGVITFKEYLYDNYTTANTANCIKLLLNRNITYSDFSITRHASYAPTAGTNNFYMYNRFSERVVVQNVETVNFNGQFSGAISFRSSILCRVSDCHLHQDIAYNFQYGITFSACCQDCVVSNCVAVGDWRHPYEAADGDSGTNAEGVCRNIRFDGCTAHGGTQAQFDTHPDGEFISFVNCGCLGTNVSSGFKLRSRRSQIIGCLVMSAECSSEAGGITLDGDCFDSMVKDCIIRNCGKSGIEVLDGTSGMLIQGNLIDNNTLDGIKISAGASRYTIIGNTIKNNGGAGISGLNFDESTISNNIINDNGAWGIDLEAATCTSNIITNNRFVNNASGSINNGDQVNNIIQGNIGYTRSNPFAVENPAGIAGLTNGVNVRSGLFTGISGTHGEGMLGASISSVGTVTNINFQGEGRGQSYATGATNNANAGWRQTVPWLRRDVGVYMKARIQPSTTTAIRAFIGFTTDTADIAGETPLANFSGVAIGKRSADTNWQIIRNDGDATTDFVDTGIAFAAGPAIIEIILDATSFRGSINGTPIAEQTTEIPASSTVMNPQIEIETSAAADKTLTIYWAYVRAGSIL